MKDSDDDWLDQDINQMNLNHGEKAGLQLYRNYTRSFDKHAINEFRAFIQSSDFDVSDLEKIIRAVATEDIRIAIISVCAFCDDALHFSFDQAVPSDVPGGKRELFGGFGPLSDFSKRIRMAYVFDVMSKDLLNDLNQLRSIRNDISHSWDYSNINEKYVSEKLINLYAIRSLSSLSENLENIYKTLGFLSKIKICLIWICGRTKYESLLYNRAKLRRIDPVNALYDNGGTKLLEKISELCMDASYKTASMQNS